MTTEDPFKIQSERISDTDLSGLYHNKWVEESFDIDQDANAKLGTAHTRSYLGIIISRRTLNIYYAIILMALSILFAKTFYLQIVKGSYYRNLAEQNRVRLRPIAAERGIIYDRFDRELVQNIPGFTLNVIPQDLPRTKEERDSVLARLSELSGISPEDINNAIGKKLTAGYESIVIKTNLDYQTALSLYLKSSSLPGVSIESGTKRKYLTGDTTSSTVTLSHVLGYVGKLNEKEASELSGNGYLRSDVIGRTGVESSYENALRGTYGRESIEVDARGREQNIIAMEPPTPGKNVILTIDIDAQRKLEALVAKAAATLGKRGIAAVALNPKDGGILAMVSWPTFDNNQFSGGISQVVYDGYIQNPDHPLFNRVIAGTYPPGSTAKIMVAAAALQEGIINRNTTVLSTGGIHVGRWFFKDWRVGGHGVTNVTKALAWSINTFFYYVGGGYQNFTGLGIQKLLSYLDEFNLGKKTGIDIPGESSGFLPSVEWKKRVKGESWFVGDTYNLSIGQGDMLVTPLQDALWTATIANGGIVYKPHVASKIVDPITKSSTKIEPVALNKNFLSPSTVKVVQDGMRECVLTGSCHLLSTLSFTSAGKTGTAQWGDARGTQAWFTSYAPFENPQIVITVLIEEGGEGGVVSIPIARDFLAWWGAKYLK